MTDEKGYVVNEVTATTTLGSLKISVRSTLDSVCKELKALRDEIAELKESKAVEVVEEVTDEGTADEKAVVVVEEEVTDEEEENEDAETK